MDVVWREKKIGVTCPVHTTAEAYTKKKISRKCYCVKKKKKKKTRAEALDL